MAGESVREVCKTTVDRVVAGFLFDPSERSFEGFAEFEKLDTNVLLSELLMQVHETSEGIDVDALEHKIPGPDIEYVRKVVRSVTKHDMNALHEVVQGDLSDLIVGLVLVIARLRKEALDAEIDRLTYL